MRIIICKLDLPVQDILYKRENYLRNREKKRKKKPWETNGSQDCLLRLISPVKLLFSRQHPLQALYKSGELRIHMAQVGIDITFITDITTFE